MTSRIGDWVQVYSGRQFWPLDPRPDEIDIEDIAHSLAHQCRFAGHTESFYSVAEHSVRVSRIVPEQDALWGLLHDASEAYLVDVPRPIKPSLKGYREIETGVMAAVCVKFGLPLKMPESVAIADNRLLATEARDLMKRSSVPWSALNARPLQDRIAPWTSHEAKYEFLELFARLTEASTRETLPELPGPEAA